VAPVHALGMVARRAAPVAWRRGLWRCSSTVSSTWGGDVVTSLVKGEGGGVMGSLTDAQAR
jgi:hypothetical protein